MNARSISTELPPHANETEAAGQAPAAPRPEALLLIGPTASGKSALVLQLAEQFELEVISLDSAQVYRGLDIGAAKPSAQERARIMHHLVDIRDPAQPYSVADFLRDAAAAVADIRRRGRLPLIAGGTMMYARALREGMAQLPGADPTIRARLEAEAAQVGWPALHERLSRVDAATARRLAPADRQRIGRALEIFERIGRPMSELLARQGPRTLALRTIALMPQDKARLHRRIEERFDAMLRAGFLDEVRALRARGDLHADLPAMRSVGYRQAWEHLEHGTPFEEFRTAAIAATRQLAKRQMTWLRSMDDTVRIDPFVADAGQRAVAAVRDAFAAARRD